MKYFVTLRSHTYEIDVRGGRVTVDGEAFEAHLAVVPGTPLYHLLLAGQSWTVAAQSLDGVAPLRWALGAVGERFEVEAVDDRTRQIQALTGRGKAPSSGGVVRAPMPGLVVRVEVAVGQQVDTGAGLVVVEAMKMENELRAPKAGRVKAVAVVAGDPVEAGRVLVVIE